MKEKVKRISAIERLDMLPAFFRGSDMTMRFGFSSKTASQYLYMWQKKGLVEGLGGRSDVWANLLVDRRPNWEYAIRIAMPSSIIIGIEALRRAGWTTQIPARPTVAVNSNERYYRVNRFNTQPRSARWFKESNAGIQRPEYIGDLPMLSPGWALADLLREKEWGKFGLHRDDIEWEEVTPKDEEDWEHACHAYGLLFIPLQAHDECHRYPTMR